MIQLIKEINATENCKVKFIRYDNATGENQAFEKTAKSEGLRPTFLNIRLQGRLNKTAKWKENLQRFTAGCELC